MSDAGRRWLTHARKVTPDWHPEDEPFLRPYALHTADRLTEMTVYLRRTQGVDGWSVGKLARAINITPQAVLKGYPRARVIELICMAFGQRSRCCARSRSWPAASRRADDPSNDRRHLTWEAAADLLRSQVAELVVDNQLSGDTRHRGMPG
jgi:hypothetical protein